MKIKILALAALIAGTMVAVTPASAQRGGHGWKGHSQSYGSTHRGRHYGWNRGRHHGWVRGQHRGWNKRHRGW